MAETTFTFRVDKALKSSFARAAKARDRAGSQLLRDFMRNFVAGNVEKADHDAWFRRQVQAGLDEADSGPLVPADEVEAEFTHRRAETRRRIDDAS
jgi:predicted transcriptional regulator